MNGQMTQLHGMQTGRLKAAIGVSFGLYLLLSAYTIIHHEMWGDEIHSWNIAKGSTDFSNLLHNIRYEGHPSVWYIILWTLSKFTHNLVWVQAVHWLIASLSVFLILFFSPLPVVSKILLPFGYYFLFEYSVLSRNYAIAVLLTFCLCIILRKDFRYKMLLYYGLLFLLSNTHLLGMLMAASIHVYFLLLYNRRKQKKSLRSIHAVIGLLVVLTGVYFIFPPSDSEMNVQFWLNRWGMRNFINFSQAPLRAFMPVQAWWKYNSWNTEFVIEAVKGNNTLLIVSEAISGFIVILLIVVLKKDRRSQVLFCSHLLFSFIVAMTFFTLGAARYAGFLYIAFIAAYWLHCYETPPAKKNRYIINAFLVVQALAAFTPVAKDIRYPFSNAYRVNELLAKVTNEKVVTDYWTLNAIAAFADKPFYCVDLQKEVYFLKWDGELKSKVLSPDRYTNGLNRYFTENGINKVYLVSTIPSPILFRVDGKLAATFTIRLIDSIEGAIEKDSNLYLYQISKPPDEH